MHYFLFRSLKNGGEWARRGKYRVKLQAVVAPAT
jgi:hypothetical protein